MNDIVKVGEQWYDPIVIQKTYAVVIDDYHAFALQKTSEAWWRRFRERLHKGDLVLDLGCGSGIAAHYLTESGLQVIGVDDSKEMITLARQQAPQAIFHCHDMEDTPSEKGQFDGICMFFSLLHLPKTKTKRMLYHAYSWLKAGGTLAITVVKGEGEGLCENFMGKDILVYLSYYQGAELLTLLTQVGFTLEREFFGERAIKTDTFEETELFIIATKPA